MKLLINADVVRSSATDIIKDGENTILKIKYCEDKISKEYIFKIPYNIMYKLQLINNLSISETENECEFVYTENETDESIYAILHSEELYPSDIFIPLNRKENVKVIKKFDYINYNKEYGEFISSIYFVKLKVEPQRPLRICKGPQNSKIHNRYFEILNGENNLVTVKRKWANNSKFIYCVPLSKL